jgi:hypothetical protein
MFFAILFFAKNTAYPNENTTGQKAGRIFVRGDKERLFERERKTLEEGSYSISRRFAAGAAGSFLGRVRLRTPSLYSALMASVSMPVTSKLRE